MCALNDDQQLDTLTRWAAPVAATFASVWAVLQVAVVALPPRSTAHVWVALVATLGYLPLYAWNVGRVARGRRPFGAWSVAVIAVIVATATAPVGPRWLPVSHVVAVTTILVLPRWWSWVVFAGTAAVQVPLGQMMDRTLPAAGSYYALTMVWRSATVLVPVWLLRTAGELALTRREIADQAIVAERVRIDDDIRRAVAPALGSIVAHGENASRLVGSRSAIDEARRLVDESRHALAHARRLIRSYQHTTMATEVDAALAILRAAGIDATADVTDDASHLTVDARSRAELHALIADVLDTDAATSCTISVTVAGGRVRIGATSHVAPASVVSP